MCGMRSVILRPHPVLGPVEAMRLRQNFELVASAGRVRVVIDLTGVSALSAAGLAAVTHILMRGRRTRMSMRVLLPEQGSDAGQIIDHADLWRFLASAHGATRTAPCRSLPPLRSLDSELTPA
ncbi:hypothetical protein WN67_21995 [Mycolicibacterium obuense]|uniref:STAS domain-containing protein n=2 Tax=Mycolicibacterium obuense TaxID=1807 RepID=A0A0M2JYC2_9MYCO|nr:hypothetical protein WN67_21995 [Mycolicibacterium obuense]